MASVTFFPQGTQLDNDEIVDLQVSEGDCEASRRHRLGAIFTLDTSGLDADLQFIKLQLEGDSAEINLSDTLTNLFGTTFPDVAVVESNSDGDFVSLVVELRGEPGAAPNTANILVETEATILDGLVNDGATDVGVTVIEAIDANDNDVTDLFEPTSQAIDLQPSPQVQEILGTEENEPIIGTPQNDLIVGNEDGDLSQEPFSNLIVFGDSLSDTGNVFNATEGSVPPSPLYDDGRFSNGDLIVDAIAESLELPENESFQSGGNNYAFGAAQTGDGTSEYGFLLPELIDVPNIEDQIDLYLADRTPTQTDLFYVYGGTNDFIDPLLRGETLPTPEEIVGNITTHITELAEAGAQTFVVPNLPPLGDIPLFLEQPEATAILNDVTVEFNQLLDTELDAIASELDVEIIEPDIYRIATEVQDNPADFGLSNTTDAFFDRIEPISDIADLSVTGNPEEFFFWDVFHPTAATTEIIAQEAVVSEFGVAAQANLEAYGEFTSVFGTPEADTLEVTGTKNLVFAGSGNDTVNVSHGNNRIYGDGGDDAFFLGTSDYVVGGEGSDQFWVADTELPDTANRIADFELDSDVIGFNNLGTSFENLSLTQHGNNTLIALEEKTVAILTNVDANSLDADNFAFN